jgi:hypothetical protein
LIIGVIAIVLSNYRRRAICAGIAFPVVLITAYFIYSSHLTYKIAGTRLFPISMGWQFANNALYMFEYTDPVKFPDPDTRKIDNMTKNFYSRLPRYFYDTLAVYAGDYFMLDSTSPLPIYAARKFKTTTDSFVVIACEKSAPAYCRYGLYQISHNPAAYFWQYILPNAKRYFFLPLGNPSSYNQDQDKIDSLVQSWFHFKTPKITCLTPTLQSVLLSVFPTLFLLINLYWLATLIGPFIGKHLLQWPSTPQAKIMLKVSTILLIVNFLITIISMTATFRNQAFIFMIGVPFSLLLIELMDKQNARQKEVKQTLKDNNSLILIKENSEC